MAFVLVGGLMVFGIGYVVGATIFKNFVDEKQTVLGGVLGGIGAIVLVAGVVIAGCSQMRFN